MEKAYREVKAKSLQSVVLDNPIASDTRTDGSCYLFAGKVVTSGSFAKAYREVGDTFSIIRLHRTLELTEAVISLQVKSSLRVALQKRIEKLVIRSR